MLGPLGADLRCVPLKSKENQGTPQDSKKEAMLTQGTLACDWKCMYVSVCVCARARACARVCMLMRVSGTCTLESLPSQLHLGANSKDDTINTERR